MLLPVSASPLFMLLAAGTHQPPSPPTPPDRRHRCRCHCCTVALLLLPVLLFLPRRRRLCCARSRGSPPRRPPTVAAYCSPSLARSLARLAGTGLGFQVLGFLGVRVRDEEAGAAKGGRAVRSSELRAPLPFLSILFFLYFGTTLTILTQIKLQLLRK